MCKKHKIKTAVNPTKQLMIEQILKKLKAKTQKKLKTLEFVNDLSGIEITKLLILGYIHGNKIHEYPLDLIMVIIHYVGAVSIRFDRAPEQYIKELIHNKGTVIKRGIIMVKQKNLLMKMNLTMGRLFQFRFVYLLGVQFHLILAFIIGK